ncbi:MAG: hypothetical protein P9M14_03370, partial [Candidatus Alcyoniella australis]|nr:hypothetical protein [Candidatus Alcyoniella australis]
MNKHIALRSLLSLLLILALVCCAACGPDSGDDDDHSGPDDDDQQSPPADSQRPWDDLCRFERCDEPRSLDSLGYELLQSGASYCGSITPESSFHDVLKITDLLATRFERPVEYYVQSTQTTADYTQYRIVFNDPVVGTFMALLSVPSAGTPPYSAALMTHGHGDPAGNAQQMFELGGPVLALLGVVTLSWDVKEMGIPTGDDKSLWSDELAVRLAAFNRTTYGVMVFKAALLFDFLASGALVQVDDSRIGLFGHCGGAFFSYNMLALDSRAKVAVTDIWSSFPEPGEGYAEGTPYDEILPQLFCWGGGGRLDALAALRPSFSYEYGYPDYTVVTAAQTLTAELAKPADCTDGVCGPGDTPINCPSECADPGANAPFSSAAAP